MAHSVQVTFDAHDPPNLAAFWAVVLDYEEQPPPPEFETWAEFAAANNLPADAMGNYGAIIDPVGDGPRLLFLKVPEPKAGKNRVHLDVAVSDRPAHVARLVEAGAIEHETRTELGVTWTVMEDPEGNEFCVSVEPSAQAGPDQGG